MSTDWTRTFEANGYVRAGTPKVRDDIDRIGEALKAEHWCAAEGCTHMCVTGHHFCIGHEVEARDVGTD